MDIKNFPKLKDIYHFTTNFIAFVSLIF